MSVPHAKQGEGQDRNVYNSYKRLIKNLPLLTADQIASIHFESWNEAYMRSGKQIIEEFENAD